MLRPFYIRADLGFSTCHPFISAFLLWAAVRLKSLKLLVPVSEPQTLGEHLRKRRGQLGFRQKEAAAK